MTGNLNNPIENNMNGTSHGYGHWPSPVSLQMVFGDVSSPQYPQYATNGDLLYLSADVKDKRRQVLMRIAANSGNSASEVECLTPEFSPSEQYGLRTRINEYGGKPFWLTENAVVFANAADQHLYRQSLENPREIQQLTPDLDSGIERYFTDVIALDERYFLMIMEESRSDSDNVHAIVLLDSHSNSLQTLQSGADFYSNLVVNRARSEIAWVQWDHPNMPWDNTQLFTAKLLCGKSEEGGWQIEQPDNVFFSADVSVCQLLFADNGRLFFSLDYRDAELPWQDYWNVHCLIDKQAVPVTKLEIEFGYPHWQYGDHRIVNFSENEIVVIGCAPENDGLYCINTDTLEVGELATKNAVFQGLTANTNGGLASVVYWPDRPAELTAILPDGTQQALLAFDTPLAKEDISYANHFVYSNSDCQTDRYAFFYPPCNPTQENDDCSGGLPPLLVMVHGGPTARAYGYFDIQKQFWTSRGFAILDVNHRGSSGYGRHYRDALYGQWGVADSQDIADGIQCLIEAKKVSAKHIFIRGKSAGGYAVLRMLTEYPDLFRAGACYYGIGNLATLAQETHKFEQYYTDRLIGEEYDADRSQHVESRYITRSPIHVVERLKSAMILFQGLDDKVVPPSVAQELVKALQQANLKYEYIEYPGEGHGFRQKQTNIDAWQRELRFYQEVLSDESI